MLVALPGDSVLTNDPDPVRLVAAAWSLAVVAMCVWLRRDSGPRVAELKYVSASSWQVGGVGEHTFV